MRCIGATQRLCESVRDREAFEWLELQLETRWEEDWEDWEGWEGREGWESSAGRNTTHDSRAKPPAAAHTPITSSLC